MKDVVIEIITLELLGTIWEFIAWIISFGGGNVEATVG